MTFPAEPELHYIPQDTFLEQVGQLARLVDRVVERPDYVVGVGRGGLVPAVYISHQLHLPMLSIDHSAKVPGFADELLDTIAARSAAGTRFLFIDDINDTGGTIAHIRNLLASHGGDEDRLRFAVLINNQRSRAAVDHWAASIDRERDKRWFVFPWEAVEDRASLVDAARAVPERLA